jgi:type IV pilus assembly protein PilC
MATAAASRSSAAKRSPEFYFEWEGKDKSGKLTRGEMRAAGAAVVTTTLRRQGILATKVKKRRTSGGSSIKQKDIAVFTRQLSAMMAAGVPLLQAFDIVARGSTNPRMTRMISEIRGDVETGTSLSAALRKHPLQFDALYCNLVEAGEVGGILEALLDRLAIYQEKTLAIKAKIKSALMYPIAVVIVAAIVLTVIMMFVIPSFKEVFKSFGADLPAPTLMVIAMSDFFTANWYLIFGIVGGGIYFFLQSWKRSETMQATMDRLLLRVPVFGPLVEKSAIARWTRTLATMSAAGVPLVEALDSVGGASGNAVFAQATERIQREVSLGTGLTTAMQGTNVFPPMVLQMTSIGEESGSLDQMLGKSAEFFEDEVDEMVKGLSSLMEPFIIVFLGTLIGGIVVAMYLPIFKMGQVV